MLEPLMPGNLAGTAHFTTDSPQRNCRMFLLRVLLKRTDLPVQHETLHAWQSGGTAHFATHSLHLTCCIGSAACAAQMQ